MIGRVELEQNRASDILTGGSAILRVEHHRYPAQRRKIEARKKETMNGNPDPRKRWKPEASRNDQPDAVRERFEALPAA